MNLAARMKAIAQPMSIALNADTYQHIRADFRFRELGLREVKGFGQQQVYALAGSDDIDLDRDSRMDDLLD